MTASMKFGLNLPAFGDYADPRRLGELAVLAEQAGWDGFFIWDHMFFDPSFHPMGDTWVNLAAVAMSTQRMKLGAMVTPLARRRPWKFARETVSVDQLSNGRLIVGVGLGDPVQWDFGFFNEETDNRVRAQKLDEGLEILTGLWQGEMFDFQGQHYTLQSVRFLPSPAQQPRIPIWVGGNWDKLPPKRRAARWDGYFPLKWGGAKTGLTVDEWRDIQRTVLQYRTSELPFDWVHGGSTAGLSPALSRAVLEPLEEIGITWWIESVDPWTLGDLSFEMPWSDRHTRVMRERVMEGPPRIH
ncbi:MAG: LLM class flavin-dependent oxidoreductase [Anaerolineae bacterium]